MVMNRGTLTAARWLPSVTAPRPLLWPSRAAVGAGSGCGRAAVSIPLPPCCCCCWPLVLLAGRPPLTGSLLTPLQPLGPLLLPRLRGPAAAAARRSSRGQLAPVVEFCFPRGPELAARSGGGGSIVGAGCAQGKRKKGRVEERGLAGRQ